MKIKQIITCFAICLISSSLGVFATLTYTANQIVYANQNGIEMTVDQVLDDLYYASSNFANPTGTIISVMSNEAPEGYLICDGGIYNINEYKKIAEHIKKQFGSYNYFGGNGETTFAVPDLRGEFLRGTGTNSHENSGSGSNVGIHQYPTIIPYTTNLRKGTYVSSIPGDGTNASYSNFDSTWGAGIGYDQYFSGGSQYINNKPIYASIRPTNTSVLYCIKY